MKDTKIIDIENTWSVRSVMNVSPVFQMERELWGAASILMRVNYVVYICSCSVRYEEYMCKTKHAYVMTVTSNNWTNQNVVDISLIVEQMHIFVF